MTSLGFEDVDSLLSLVSVDVLVDDDPPASMAPVDEAHEPRPESEVVDSIMTSFSLPVSILVEQPKKICLVSFHNFFFGSTSFFNE